MSAYYDSLIATRTKIVTQLEAVETDTPQYSVDSQSVSPTRDMLLKQLKEINELIDEENRESSFIVTSVVDT